MSLLPWGTTSPFDYVYNALTGHLTEGQIQSIASQAAANVAAAGGSESDQSQAYADVVAAASQPVTVVPNAVQWLGQQLGVSSSTVDYIIIFGLIILGIEIFK